MITISHLWEHSKILSMNTWQRVMEHLTLPLRQPAWMECDHNSVAETWLTVHTSWRKLVSRKQRVSLEQENEKFKVLDINILQRDAEFWGHDYISWRALFCSNELHKGLDSSNHSIVFTEYLLWGRHWQKTDVVSPLMKLYLTLDLSGNPLKTTLASSARS